MIAVRLVVVIRLGRLRPRQAAKLPSPLAASQKAKKKVAGKARSSDVLAAEAGRTPAGSSAESADQRFALTAAGFERKRARRSMLNAGPRFRSTPEGGGVREPALRCIAATFPI